MKIPFEQLENQITSLKTTIASPEVKTKFETAAREFESLNTALVGESAGQLNNGLRSLDAAGADFKVVDVSAKLNVTLKHGTTKLANLQHQIPDLTAPMSQLTQDLPELSEKLVPAMQEGSKALASAITGGEIQEAFNHMTLALPTAAAMAPAIKKMGDVLQQEIKPEEIKNVMEEATGALDAAIKGGLPEASELLDKLSQTEIQLNLDIVDAKLGAAVGKLKANISAVLPDLTELPVLDTLHKMNGSISIVLNTFPFDPNINSVAASAEVLKHLSTGNLLAASAAIAALGTGLSVPEIDAKIAELNLRLGTTGALIQSPLSGLTLNNPVLSLSNTVVPYSYVNSLEDIQAEMMNTQRKLTNVVYHWSESHANQNPTARDIEKSAGSIEYHYIIGRDGRIQRGKAIGEVAESVGNSIDGEAISVLLIGGYKSMNGEVAELTSESITSSQKKAVIDLMGTFYSILPGIKQWGHSDLDENVSSAEPGINIVTTAKTVFGKSNVKEPEVIRLHAGNSGGTNPSVQGVTYAAGGVRSGGVQSQLANILQAVHRRTGATFEIYSAGQMSYDKWVSYPANRRSTYLKNGTTYYTLDGTDVRVGSRRHDHGWAVDVKIFKDGKRLYLPSGGPEIEAIVRALKEEGIYAIGIGEGYMQGNAHLDIAYSVGRNGAGSARYWGAGGRSDKAPNWLARIMN
jgi:hypothetical protein